MISCQVDTYLTFMAEQVEQFYLKPRRRKVMQPIYDSINPSKQFWIDGVQYSRNP